MGESEQRPQWSIRNIVEASDKFMSDIGFPEMEKPDGFGQTYNFPNDVTNLRSEALGSLSLRLSGWLSYGLKVQGKEESELSAFEHVYDVKLWARVADEVGKHPVSKRSLTKDELRGKILEEDSEFIRLTQSLLLRKTKVQRIKIQNQIYQEQITRLSREQSRRDQELRSFN